MKIRTKISLSVILTTLLSVFLILGAITIYSAKDIKKDAEGSVIRIIEEEALKVEGTLSIIKLNVDNFINLITSTADMNVITSSQEENDNYENTILKTSEGIMQLSPDKNLWFIGDTRETKNIFHISLRVNNGAVVREEKYDVIAGGYDKDEWWKGPMDNGFNWSAPYVWDAWGPGTELISYGKRVEKDGKIIGVAGSEFYFNKLKEDLSKIKIFDTGYITLMDKDLNYLYHPNKEIKTPKDISEETYNLFKKEIIDADSDKGIIKYIDGKMDKILVYKKLSNGWIIAANPTLNEMFATLNRLNKIILSILILVILIGIGISLVVSKTISNPIIQMEKEFNSLAQGNLKSKLNVSSKDEIGSLSVNFNNFVGKLYETISNIMILTKEVVDNNTIVNKSMNNLVNGQNSPYYKELKNALDKGMIHLNDSIANVLDNVRNQTASSEESLAALEEVSATSENINNNIKITNTSFIETLQIANSSAKDMKEMSDSMKEITASTEQTNHEIEKLRGLSNNIGSILTAISSVSDQTNLLALNAAIEAARAGEAGRGFSVVADEIRKLAEQTNKETGKIEEIIKAIQNEVEIVKDGSNEIKIKVENGLKISLESQKNMEKIIQNNTKNAEEIQEISASVDEQAIASKEITYAIGNIAESSGHIESLSTENTEISDKVKDSIMKNQELLGSLEGLIKKLEEDLGFFKL